jgi:hypothetical protein
MLMLIEKPFSFDPSARGSANAYCTNRHGRAAGIIGLAQGEFVSLAKNRKYLKNDNGNNLNQSYARSMKR